MSRLIILILLNFIFQNISYSKEKFNNLSCKWENEFDTPCIEITSFIPNSSNFSKSGINKITITRKEIDESGAIDLVDILNFIVASSTTVPRERTNTCHCCISDSSAHRSSKLYLFADFV